MTSLQDSSLCNGRLVVEGGNGWMMGRHFACNYKCPLDRPLSSTLTWKTSWNFESLANVWKFLFEWFLWLIFYDISSLLILTFKCGADLGLEIQWESSSGELMIGLENGAHNQVFHRSHLCLRAKWCFDDCKQKGPSTSNVSSHWNEGTINFKLGFNSHFKASSLGRELLDFEPGRSAIIRSR